MEEPLRNILRILLATCLVALFASASWGASIVNGGFDAGCNATPVPDFDAAGCVHIPGWTISPGDNNGGPTYTRLNYATDAGNFNPLLVLDTNLPDSARFGDPTSTGGGHFTQDVLLTAGYYNLSFYYRGFGAPENGGFFRAFFDGGLLLDVPTPQALDPDTGGPGDTGWIHVVTSVVAPTDGTYTLDFFAANDGFDWGLDDVGLNPIPEPATIALIGVPLIALSLLRRRR
jgi:hypothetical protein